MGHAAGTMPTPQSSTEPFYRSRITIDGVDLHDVPANFRIAPGTPVTADIKVGMITMLGYLLGRMLGVVSEGIREP
jgi:hemolysin D